MIINPQWLELPMSEQIYMVSKMFELLRFDCTSNMSLNRLVRAFDCGAKRFELSSLTENDFYSPIGVCMGKLLEKFKGSESK